MPPFAYNIPEVCKTSNAGRTTVYKAINAGELVAHKRGSRTIVFASDLERWLNSLPAVEAKHSKGAELLTRASSFNGNMSVEENGRSLDKRARQARGAL